MTDHNTDDLQGKDDPNERKVRDFMDMFSQGARFTEELLQDNKKLRQKMLGLEEKLKSGGGDPGDELQQLQAKYDSLKNTYDELIGKLQTVEEENHDFARRYVEIEEENNNLANLYIASFQLHSTLNFQEVVQIIMEIVINLIGAESFAVYVFDEDAESYRPASCEGMERDTLVDIPLESSTLGKSIANDEVIINESLLNVEGADLGEPLVIVPLAIKEQKVGAILIYGLLQQKTSFAPVDRELFTLLAGHAATAIFSSRLYMESERKLSTMQGFIDLLTK